MGYRKFVDRDGQAWEIRDRSGSKWSFDPAPGNPARQVVVPAPGYEKDPFELSIEELQKLLDSAGGPPRSKPGKSPFLE